MGVIYPGTCSEKNLKFTNSINLRVRTHHAYISFHDNHFGNQYCNLSSDSGDYVIYRADNLPSYILAVSIDDVCEDYSEIVRGADLLDITHRQIHLSTLIFNRSPKFMHIPIVIDENGEKLSKKNQAPALSKYHARTWLYYALSDLGQEPPRSLLWRPLWCSWEWAITHWQPQNIPHQQTIIFSH